MGRFVLILLVLVALKMAWWLLPIAGALWYLWDQLIKSNNPKSDDAT